MDANVAGVCIDVLGFPVSSEVAEKLEIYYALLLKWQKAINLVGTGTLGEAPIRHFADSAQLARHLPGSARLLADMGSGAGFPGLVLAILCPALDVHLIESDERKSQFLRTVSRETDTAVAIHTGRIEKVGAEILPDVVTARALCDLKMLLDYVAPWVRRNPDLMCLFMKGERVEDEMKKAASFYEFESERFPSATQERACVVKVKNLSFRCE